MKFDVVSFGSAVVDVFVHTDVSEKKGFMYYPVGEKILIKDLKFDVGGAGTNTAVAFSRLGLKTGCVCEFGDDDNGRRIKELLKKEKVKFLGKTVKEELTGYSVVLDSKGGDRTILAYKGANDEVSLNDISKFKTKWLYFSSLLGKSFNTQKELAIKLKRKGTKIAFNPSSYQIKNMHISPLLKITDVLILNKQEAEMLLKKYSPKEKNLLLGLHNLTKGIIVITDKNKLITCYDGNKKYFLTPHKNIKVVERTGAGDAFASGFVAGQIVGKTIEESLKLGLRESEAVIQHFGAKNNLIRMNLKQK
ncbi:MAG TPA: carbohydrate kinase family protein [Candidatus Pacearchaeota archaeon]|nr:carbohydrate kinase family protein [Candidatus Pacearchaeota archaeon]